MIMQAGHAVLMALAIIKRIWRVHPTATATTTGVCQPRKTASAHIGVDQDGLVTQSEFSPARAGARSDGRIHTRQPALHRRRVLFVGGGNPMPWTL